MILENGLHIDCLGFLRSFHDETKAGRGVASHQITDHAIRFQLVIDFDPEQGNEFIRFSFAVSPHEVDRAIELLADWLPRYRD